MLADDALDGVCHFNVGHRVGHGCQVVDSPRQQLRCRSALSGPARSRHRPLLWCLSLAAPAAHTMTHKITSAAQNVPRSSDRRRSASDHTKAATGAQLVPAIPNTATACLTSLAPAEPVLQPAATTSTPHRQTEGTLH
ncbi:unnamed protein product [Arctia plantaginis]|uniref:Uncharacterized protein n=1 Tax=Arctia plantaginis TaxID=874455 RepID=A0A8S0ZKK6_ARCPL|nr:unnamed protein product [Arctia plantaginis]